MASHDITERWQVDWVWEALWLVIYVFVMGAISVIWRPTTNNTRYAYSELSDNNNDDNNYAQLSQQAVSQNFGTEVTQRKEDSPTSLLPKESQSTP